MPDDVIHRWLPSEYKAKYEAIDFVKKFGLESSDFFSISNDNDELVKINPDKNEDGALVENVNIIVSCGSTSTQAYKITKKGVKVLLPISQTTKDDYEIKTENYDTLNYEKMNSFGGKSGDKEIAKKVIDYLNENENINNENANINNDNTKKTNLIFVNQLGYSILGFNPRGEEAPTPTRDQKVVKINEGEFNDNKGKTQLIEILKTEIELKNLDNMFLIARQCKVMIKGKKEEIS